jgi:hypothetical protein
VTAADLLTTAITLLDGAGVPFMVTGSYASSYHGEPRATLDLDIVIDPDAESLARLVGGLVAARFYVDAGAATSALAERGQFNAIGRDASKIDFIVRGNRAFSKAEFERRIPVDILGTPGFMATAEDMIIAKLEWAAASDSERQLRDVEGIWAANREHLDLQYLGHWMQALGLTETWNRVSRD